MILDKKLFQFFMVYHSISHNSFFLWNFKSEENKCSCLWNTEQILISETIQIVSDKSKYLEILGIWRIKDAGLGHKKQHNT